MNFDHSVADVKVWDPLFENDPWSGSSIQSAPSIHVADCDDSGTCTSWNEYLKSIEGDLGSECADSVKRRAASSREDGLVLTRINAFACDQLDQLNDICNGAADPDVRLVSKTDAGNTVDGMIDAEGMLATCMDSRAYFSEQMHVTKL